ncbi:Guanosine-diphosphatase [Polyrhizophydium stewartii]|uniref:guanosine-diphosphatase n=1 Tax=Polyrhizophydium stewartii TaxID=2732419 RepID=A0ABR4NDZ8_9FUNG
MSLSRRLAAAAARAGGGDRGAGRGGLLALALLPAGGGGGGGGVARVPGEAAAAGGGPAPLVVAGFARTAAAACARPAAADRPAVQYALVVDAGSTGSRIHVYRFNYCGGAQPALEDEVFHQLKPGLSAFADPAAAASLDPLLRTALANVPAALHRCTPVTVKATAGLRMLAGDLSTRILAAVRAKLESEYPFPVVKTDGVVVMDGSDEGVYAWITVNYLLGRIGADSRKPTAAILDLGGGSTQIVFEPDMAAAAAAAAAGADLPEGDHRYDLSFGGRVYKLYQHSYDGYGLRAGRKALVQASAAVSPEGDAPGGQIASPCVPAGRGKDVLADDPKVTGGRPVLGTAQGFQSCRALIAQSPLFDTSPATCERKSRHRPCSFDGVYMPSLRETFAANDMYAFSYFYDMYAEPFESTSEFRVGDLQRAAETVCKGDAAALHVNRAKQFYGSNPFWCMDLSFMHQLLNVGYGLPDSRVMKTAKKIRGIETGWALGAAIRILDELVTSSAGACA